MKHFVKPFDENDLIAYHLDELPPRRRRALERALLADAALAAESDAIAETLRGFKGHSPMDLDTRLDKGLVQWNWQALSPLLPRYPAKTPPFYRRHLPVLAGAGLAFAAVTVTMVRWHHLPTAPGSTASGSSVKASVPTMPPQNTARDADVLRSDAASAAPLTQRTARSSRPAAAQLVTGVALVRQHPHAGLPVTSASPTTPAVPPQVAAVPQLPLPMQAETPAPTNSASPSAPSAEGTPTSAALAPGSSAPGQASASGSADGKKRGHGTAHHGHTTELTLAMGGTFLGPGAAYTNGVSRFQSATHAVVAMALFHQQFRPALGYRVAFSYTRPDFDYGYANINGKLYEAAATYVVQGPGKGKLSTSAEAGAGLMRITPTIEDSTTPGSNTRVAGIFGVAADFMLSRHIGLHAAYRGQVFTAPDFHYSGYGPPITTGTLVSSEPSLGITYRFSHR